MAAQNDDKLQILETKRCEVCQKQGLHRCGGCRRIYYCSKQHQREHWKEHKNSCKFYKIHEDDSGHHVVAAKAINPGECVLQESPLIWGPSFNSPPICLGCGKSIDAETSRACIKCGWPVCDHLCEKSPSHFPECRYTTQRGERVDMKNFGEPQSVYRCITVLRCLYLKQFLPKIWKKLEKLESSLEKRKLPTRYQKERVTIAEFIRRFFKLYTAFSVDDIMKICDLVMIYGHEVPVRQPPVTAIYATSSMIEHNCSANCTRSFTNLGEIVISAARPILEGEHLSISYTDALCGTTNRRNFLYENKFFWCHCQRCEDPTEFGTNFSTLKCQSINCDGLVLPPSFTEIKKIADWVCDKCHRSISPYSTHDLLDRTKHDLQDLDKTRIDDCKEFVETYRSYLHENHFYLVSIKYALCQLLGPGSLEANKDDLDLKYQCCCNLESVIKIIAPAEKRALATVLFEKYSAFVEIGRRTQTEPTVDSLKGAKDILLEVLELLKHEREGLPKDNIYKQADQSLTEVNSLLQCLNGSEVEK